MKQFIAGLGIGLTAGLIYIGANNLTQPETYNIFSNSSEQACLNENLYRYDDGGNEEKMSNHPHQGYADLSKVNVNRYFRKDGYLPTLSYGGKEVPIYEIKGKLVIGGPGNNLEGLLSHGEDWLNAVKDNLK